MIKSMTAYGRGEYNHEGTLFISEIKSLNNRYRDIILHIPEKSQALEDTLRSIIISKVRRGRVEVNIQMENGSEEASCNLELNVPVVIAYLKIFNQLTDQFGLDQEIQLESFCQMKDVILIKPETVEIDKTIPGFQNALRQALDSLDMMRIKEGKAIEADFVNRLDLLEKYVNEVDKRMPSLVEKYRNRLKDKIQNILKEVPVDEDKLTQEVAFFAEKSDITEEIVRIRSHLEQFRDYLSLDDALGRRLDFLIQEINREVNTIGSKASDSTVSRIVVEIKVELEKLREQVQNVE